MKKHTYKGVVVPMITPVTTEGEIDTHAIEKIIQLFASCHVSPLLMGTTGEGNSVSVEQGKQVVEAAVKSVPTGSDMVIYAGLNGCSTRDHIQMAETYKQLGADVIVATLPSYYALTDEQMCSYYKTLADNIKAPLMLYNIKATTHMSIPLEVIHRLSQHPNIVGLKDSERDPERLKEAIALSKATPGFSYFCGWAAQSANSLLESADGIVPSTGNFVPQMFTDLYEAAMRGDKETAQKLQEETDEIARIYQANRTLGQSLAALKVMMGTKDLCGPDMLSPLTRLTLEEEQEIILKTP